MWLKWPLDILAYMNSNPIKIIAIGNGWKMSWKNGSCPRNGIKWLTVHKDVSSLLLFPLKRMKKIWIMTRLVGLHKHFIDAVRLHKWLRWERNHHANLMGDHTLCTEWGASMEWGGVNVFSITSSGFEHGHLCQGHKGVLAVNCLIELKCMWVELCLACSVLIT